MTAYGLFFVGPDGHVDGVEIIEAVDDEAAIKSARRFAGARSMELWNLDKPVMAFPATPPGRLHRL